MADAEGEDKQEEAGGERPAARFEIRDELPGGRLVYPLIVDGEMVWLVLKGHMTEELCASVNEYLRHIVDSGMWDQQDGGFTNDPPDAG